MAPIFAIITTIIKFWALTAFGFVCWILSPLKWNKRAVLAGRINKLTFEAVEGLNCNAKSSIVYLPDTDVKLHVVEAGKHSDKLVILLHGFPDNFYCWKRVIPELAKNGFFVVAPDLRGYNLSDKVKGIHNYTMKAVSADVLGLIKYYGKKKAHAVVAHDWGGAVAWNFALQYPESLDKLVILNSPHPSAFMSGLMKSWNQRLASWYMVFFQVPVIPESLYFFFGPSILKAMYKGKISESDLEYVYCALLQPGAIYSMLAYYRALGRSLLKGKGNGGVNKSTVDTPTLLIWGLDDIALTKDVSDPSRWVSNLQTNYLSNVGHFVLNEAPHEVNKSLLAFL